MTEKENISLYSFCTPEKQLEMWRVILENSAKEKIYSVDFMTTENFLRNRFHSFVIPERFTNTIVVPKLATIEKIAFSDEKRRLVGAGCKSFFDRKPDQKKSLCRGLRWTTGLIDKNLKTVGCGTWNYLLGDPTIKASARVDESRLYKVLDLEDRSAAALKKLNQQPGDFLVIPCHLNKVDDLVSGSCIRDGLVDNEFALSSHMVASGILMQLSRLEIFEQFEHSIINDFGVDCLGDKYTRRERTGNVYHATTFYYSARTLRLNCLWVDRKISGLRPAIGFVPTEV